MSPYCPVYFVVSLSRQIKQITAGKTYFTFLPTGRNCNPWSTY